MASLRTDEGEYRKRTPRRWRDKFAESFDGLRRGIQGQSSFFVHGFFMTLAVAGLLLLGCDSVEWCLIFGCIGLVLSLELMNSAIETLFRGFPAEARDRTFGALHISAAAVLTASTTAVAIGGIVFGRRLVMAFGIFGG